MYKVQRDIEHQGLEALTGGRVQKTIRHLQKAKYNMNNKNKKNAIFFSMH